MLIKVSDDETKESRLATVESLISQFDESFINCIKTGVIPQKECEIRRDYKEFIYSFYRYNISEITGKDMDSISDEFVEFIAKGQKYEVRDENSIYTYRRPYTDEEVVACLNIFEQQSHDDYSSFVMDNIISPKMEEYKQGLYDVHVR